MISVLISLTMQTACSRFSASPTPACSIVGDRQVDLRDRLRMVEPGEAVQILREFGEVQGISLDERPAMPEHLDYTIRLATGELTVEPGVEQALYEKVEALQGGEEGLTERYPQAEVPVLLEFNRQLSLAEMIELYELGVKGLTNELGSYSHIVLVPSGSFSSLMHRPYVRWMGEYRDEYKYLIEGSSSSDGGGALIYPIDKARDEYESSLVQMGVSVSHYDDTAGFYYVMLAGESFPDVAQLWWIRWIEKEPVEVPESP